MNLLLSNSLSALLLLICQHTEAPGVQSNSVIQTPSFLNVVEGDNLKMECKIEVFHRVWYAVWHVNKTDGNMKLDNTSSTSIVTNSEKKWSYLILKRADITDSGIYTCMIGFSDKTNITSTGTKVTVCERTDLMVNQTLAEVIKEEGANVTIDCRFWTVSNYSTMYVRWKKDGKNLDLERDSLTMIRDLEKGFASLTLSNIKKADSGSYVCEVGSSLRNLSGSGIPIDIRIRGRRGGRRSMPNNGTEHEGKDSMRTVMVAGVGAGVGVILLALLIIILVWRRKLSSQGAPLATSEPENVSAEQARTQHLPLASQASDVTYADLSFNKRDVKLDAEVVYAEVKVGRK